MLATLVRKRGASLRSLCSLLIVAACTDAAPTSEPHAQETAGAAPTVPMMQQSTSSTSAGTPAAVGGHGGHSGGDSSSAQPSPATTPAASQPTAGQGGQASPAPTSNSAGMMAAAGAGNGPTPMMAGAGGSGDGHPTNAAPASCTRTAADSSTPVVYVIGDSTASVYEANLYPRTGWAQPLQDYFKPACAKVQDKALSGRSSKSFLDEGAWKPIKAALHAGDFVLIQFGHNDEKRDDAARFTEPFDSFQRYLSTYIDDTIAAGATPILLTSIERNNWSDGKLKSTHGDYPQATRALGEMRKLTVVDMTQLTHAYLEGLGQAASTKLFMNLAAGESPNYPNGNSDNTHLQEKGARAVADLALADLARQHTPLAALLDHVPTP